MADLIETKATFPKSGGLAVANGAVSVNAGNGLHVNPSTGIAEVPVDTTAGLGYGSNGLEVEVDGSTIGFNSAGQLTALGGGGGGFKTFAYGGRIKSTFKNWTICPGNSSNHTWCSGIYNDDLLYIQGIGVNFNAFSSVPIIVGRNDNKTFSLSNSNTNMSGENVNNNLVMPVYAGGNPNQFLNGGNITIVSNKGDNELYLKFSNGFSISPTYFGGGLIFVVNS